MTRPRAHLNAFITTTAPDPALDHYVRVARTAERGLFDSVLLDDQAGLDPLDLAAALAPETTHLGLIATASTSHAPYELARRVSTLDHLSGGRAGWNLSLAADSDDGERFARAAEFVDVVRTLWDTWDDDAIVDDTSKGIWADPEKIHPAGFRGSYYDVAGALAVPRAPQGHPVLGRVGSSAASTDLAGRVASLDFTPQPTIEAGRTFRAKLQAAARDHGRPADSILSLPSLAFVLGSTEAEATARHDELGDTDAGFAGTPEQLAELIEKWVTEGGSDGFTLQSTTLPDSLELFVDHVVPLLQKRGLHRTEYTGTTLRDHLGLARPEAPIRSA